MKMTDVKAFIERHTGGIQVLPFSFAEQANDECIRFEINQGGSDIGTVSEVVITTDIRSKDPARAEDTAIELNDALHNLTDDQLGNKQIIAIKRRQTYPRYLGVDNSGRTYYSNDYLFILGE